MDIQILLDQARDEMSQSGHLMPTIFLELDKNVKKKNGRTRHRTQVHLFALDILNDHQNIAAQGGLVYQLACEHCKKYSDWEPVTIAYFGEAWTARSQLPELMIDPSKDPDRVEVVIVEMWQARKVPQKQTYLLSIIRSATDNTLTKLGEPIGPRDTISLQLESFLHGALDSQKPDAEVWEPRIKALQEKILSIPPEKREGLIEFMVQNGIPREVIDEVLKF